MSLVPRIWPRLQGVPDVTTCVDRLGEGERSGFVPAPGVLERLDLRRCQSAAPGGEENVVALVALEGRVEVDEIDRFVSDVFPENREVVAVVEGVLRQGRNQARASCDTMPRHVAINDAETVLASRS